MALLSPQLERFLLTKLSRSSSSNSNAGKSTGGTTSLVSVRGRAQCSSAMAIDAPSSSSVARIRWGSTSLQGLREEMEDEVVVRLDELNGFSFAAVLDGHGGVSSVKFLREELYRECAAALQGGLLLSGKDSNAIRDSLKEAFENVDARLLDRLEMIGDGDESGSTATVILMGNDVLIVAHIGDSSVVLSRSGIAKVLTDPHRPYGSSKSSLQEIKRIREAGGWISNGRICSDIAVSRAFGDIRFKTKKNEMLQKGVLEGRWSEKFISRVRFSGDLVVAEPDVFQIPLESASEFVLLASDGLWDYINSSEAVNFVRSRLRKHGDVQLACEELAQTALDRRSQDNISIVIADLGRTDWQALPVQQQNFFYELGQAFATVGVVLLGIWMSSQFPL